MFARIHEFFNGPSPLSPSVVKGISSPRTFRRLEPKDLPHCLELYRLNEPGRFPAGVMEQYEKSLVDGRSYHLVTETDGRVVASGGISYYAAPDRVVLCFGLVHPEHQGRGLGTALLLTRLALLKPDRSHYLVGIFAVKDSFAFYERFGFQHVAQWRDTHGDEHPAGRLLFTGAEVRRCRKLLASRGIIWPPDADQIPCREPAVPDAATGPN